MVMRLWCHVNAMVYGHVLWLLLATSLQALAENQSLPPSPCPEIFQYQVDPGGIWYGLINVPTPEPDYNVKLKVELGLDAILPNVTTITKLSLEHMLYPVRLNSVPENINNPVTQDSDKANLNLQPQDVKVYYQHFPPPQSGSTQGTNNGNINLQDQNVKIYYHQYSPPESILSQPQYQSSVPYQAVAQNQPATPMQYQSGVPQQNQPIVPLQPPTQYQSGVPQQNQPIVSLQPPSQYQSGVPQQNQPIAPKPPTQYQPSIPPEQNQSTFPRQPPMQYQPTLTPQQNLPFQTIMPRQPQNQPETQSVNFPNLQTQKEKPPQPGGFQVFIPSIQPAPTAEPVKPVQTVPARTKSPPHLTPPPRTKRPSTTTTTTSTTTVAPENVLGIDMIWLYQNAAFACASNPFFL
ncbi:hypothetical protein C0J52_20889 [Blattella germanica]|nr:hypothetical protein C0J52_20889 [Blattella germanica]